MKSALSVPELVMEINSRTLVRLLSERLPKQGRRVLGLLLSGCSPEMTARMLGTGVRQVWLAEQTLKQRWDILTGVPLSDAVRIRIPDVGPDISQQSGLVKLGPVTHRIYADSIFTSCRAVFRPIMLRSE